MLPVGQAAYDSGRILAAGPDRPGVMGNGDLSNFEGRVADSGEGRWTSSAAIDVGAPAPILTTALYERFMSRGEADFADQILSAMMRRSLP